MNECVDVGDQTYDIETNLCEDDVDLKLIVSKNNNSYYSWSHK